MSPKQTFFQKLLGINKPAPEPVAPVVDPIKVREAIAYNETRGVKGDPYAFSQPSGIKALGNAMGRYQVTEGELNTYSPKYLGHTMTVEAFKKSKTAQDRYMDAKISYYLKQGYTPEQIADIHRAGVKNSSDPGMAVYQNPGYVESFKNVYNK